MCDCVCTHVGLVCALYNLTTCVSFHTVFFRAERHILVSQEQQLRGEIHKLKLRNVYLEEQNRSQRDLEVLVLNVCT